MIYKIIFKHNKNILAEPVDSNIFSSMINTTNYNDKDQFKKDVINEIENLVFYSPYKSNIDDYLEMILIRNNKQGEIKFIRFILVFNLCFKNVELYYN